jgi:hypothetical protein
VFPKPVLDRVNPATCRAESSVDAYVAPRDGGQHPVVTCLQAQDYPRIYGTVEDAP